MSSNNSLISSITKCVQNNVDSYIDLISEKYSLDKQELRLMWSNPSLGARKARESEDIQDAEKTHDEDNLTEFKLMCMTIPELKAWCKKRSLKCSGTKPILVNRLLGRDETIKIEKVDKKEKKIKPKVLSSPALEKLKESKSSHTIKLSKFGNNVHSPSKLVFDTKTKKVVGKENKNGNVDSLTAEDIEQCKKYKFDYSIPDNLGVKINLESVKVDGLEEVEKEIEVEGSDVDDDTGSEEDTEEELVIETSD